MRETEPQIIRIATVNVNGVRAALRKGMGDWLARCGADIVCLQEVRAPRDVLEAAFSEWTIAHDESQIPGRAGAAILSRLSLDDVIIGFPGSPGADKPTHSGRWVEATVVKNETSVRIVSVYVHSGEAGTSKMDDKFEFLDLMTDRMGELAAHGGRVIITGDINIAHTKSDIKNWRGNLKSAGFLPEERAYLDRWLASGWVDVHRTLVGDREGPYTWWSQRGQAFDNDTGWRLDYQIASPGMATAAREARVDRAPSWDTRWSDHAPLIVDYSR